MEPIMADNIDATLADASNVSLWPKWELAVFLRNKKQVAFLEACSTENKMRMIYLWFWQQVVLFGF